MGQTQTSHPCPSLVFMIFPLGFCLAVVSLFIFLVRNLQLLPLLLCLSPEGETVQTSTSTRLCTHFNVHTHTLKRTYSHTDKQRQPKLQCSFLVWERGNYHSGGRRDFIGEAIHYSQANLKANRKNFVFIVHPVKQTQTAL